MQLGKFFRKLHDPRGEYISQPHEGRSHDRLEEQSTASDQAFTSQGPVGPVAVMENTDPFRRRIVMPRRGLFWRVMRWIANQVMPLPVSPEERAELDEEKSRQALKKVLDADAEVCARFMISCFDRLSICYYTREEGRIKFRKHIEFAEIREEPDCLHFYVDMHRLPFGVTLDMLKDGSTVDNLSASVGRAISVSWTPETGVIYTVERASGRAGIPGHVKIADLWERMPSTASTLTWPIGVTNNARRIYGNLADMPHALVGGTTLSGKTNFLHSAICTFVHFNVPEAVKLLLVDLKGGMAFTRYKGLPHLLTGEEFSDTGIITERERVFTALDWLVNEGESRMRTMADAGYENIALYNARRKRKLPYIVLVIDEWADMMYRPEDKKIAEPALVNLIQRMRAVGIHVMLATQVPKSEVITGLIKGNLPCRFGFSVPNIHASQAILDNRAAVGLQPKGRCVMQFMNERQVQTPYISPETVDRIVEQAITGTAQAFEGARHDVTEREVMEWAINSNNGWLTRERVFPAFRERGITRHELTDWIESWEGNEYLVGNTLYTVVRPSGNRGYRIIAAKSDSTPEETHDDTVQTA